MIGNFLKSADSLPPHAELIKAALRMRGTSCAEIARDLGLSHTAVSFVVHGINRSVRIECAIAKALGVKPEQVWPDHGRHPDARRGKATNK